MLTNQRPSIGISSSSLAKLQKKTPTYMNLSDPTWRINNLYYIKDEKGNKVKFQLNWAQRELYEGLHNFDIILKARQLGITTFFCIYLLDKVLWENNIQAGIIAHTLDDAQNIFQDKLRFAFDQLDPPIRSMFRAVGESSKELAFTHGSVIRVGTSLRSSTLQYLHVSEFGKICAKYPEKAREIVTGALNTVHVGSSIYIESTAEGREGKFYDLCTTSQNATTLGPLDFKFFFFPWWKHPAYVLHDEVVIPTNLKEYFAKLALDNVVDLTKEQMWWYTKKSETQGDDMPREFPSTPAEAFQASQEGNWYALQMKGLWDAGHITNVSYDAALPVYTAWDLGQADFTAIWFFQLTRQGEINVIDYFQGRDKPLDQLTQILNAKKYSYSTCIWPSDANARDRAGITFVSQARNFGWKGVVLDQHSLRDGINLVRSTLSKCWFDQNKCHEGISALENYKKRWNTAIGGWSSEPLHDDYSHGADAFRYLCAGLPSLSNSMRGLDQDYKALRKYWG
jgi:hypothetical protein